MCYNYFHWYAMHLQQLINGKIILDVSAILIRTLYYFCYFAFTENEQYTL